MPVSRSQTWHISKRLPKSGLSAHTSMANFQGWFCIRSSRIGMYSRAYYVGIDWFILAFLLRSRPAESVIPFELWDSLIGVFDFLHLTCPSPGLYDIVNKRSVSLPLDVISHDEIVSCGCRFYRACKTCRCWILMAILLLPTSDIC